MKSVIIRSVYAHFLLLLLMFFSCTDRTKTDDNPTTASQVLCNGIGLPDEWPPKYPVPSITEDMPVPYLNQIPEILPINIGRQLFVDDFLVESKEHVTRKFHHPEYFGNSPVLRADKSWEYTKRGDPYAAPFSDGVWYDEKDNKFKMWYLAGGGKFNPEDVEALITCYAESEDGIIWVKPELDYVAETNIVDTTNRDSNTVWLDKNETDQSKRYKSISLVNIFRDHRWRLILKYSNDGIHWSYPVAQSGDNYDRSTLFYNPFRDKWIWSLKNRTDLGRSRNYLEHSDIELGTSLAHRASIPGMDKYVHYWFGAYEKEPRNPDYPAIQPEIYNHDAIAYESLMLGFFNVWQGPENDVCDSLGIQKRNEVLIGYSRDGFHWDRPQMQPFHPVVANSWNHANIQSANGVPIIVGDSLFFYMSGRYHNPEWDSNTSTGLATMRRDGFASINAGETEGHITTRKLSFDGEYLFVNTDASQGQLLAELLYENGEVIEGYTKADCVPVKSNGTKISIQWNGKPGIENVPGLIKMKFYLTGASLFSFWISKYETGESGGYTAGGGPELHFAGRDLPLTD